MPELSLEDQLKKMAQDWDSRARENARHYVATGKEEWSDEEFFASGERAVEEQILNDMINICQGSDPEADARHRDRLRRGAYYAGPVDPVRRGARR